MRHWLRNRSRDTVAEAQEALVRAPEPTVRHNPLEGHDVALYVDGKRVSALAWNVESDGDRVTVTFETLAKAALEPGADVSLLQAWGTFQAGETVLIKQPGKPQGGVLHIRGVIPPKKAGEIAFFIGKAMTRIVDWNTGDVLAEPGEDCEVPTGYCVKQS